MNQIKEITVFTIGDSNEIKTWSNVPYFFTKTLIEKNIKVNRVNLEENKLISKVYKYTYYVFLKLFNKNSNHTYFRSKLNYYLTKRKIKSAITNFPSSQYLLFLSFSFSIPKINGKKTILFGDWTYLYFISNFLKRKPLWFEQYALNKEKDNIETSDMVLSLFPKSHEFNLKQYNNRNQYYLGNVINCNYELNRSNLIAEKIKSNKLLFIGNKKYLQGAIDLINAFKQLSIKAELHIIGLIDAEVGINAPGLYYHGYLDKGKTSENELYYKLITEARVIINTNPNWGAFSAMTEAMYFLTPVITSPYQEFVITYGDEIDFGFYVEPKNIKDLILKIEMILSNSSEQQNEMMNNAHEKVKDFTWSSYTNQFLRLIENS